MASPSIWKCEHCGAPNPQSSDECYSCKTARIPAETQAFVGPPGPSAQGAATEVDPESPAPPMSATPGPAAASPAQKPIAPLLLISAADLVILLVVVVVAVSNNARAAREAALPPPTPRAQATSPEPATHP